MKKKKKKKKKYGSRLFIGSFLLMSSSGNCPIKSAELDFGGRSFVINVDACMNLVVWSTRKGATKIWLLGF